jgi:uncharacterized protein YndB with AHSA1/START domain
MTANHSLNNIATNIRELDFELERIFDAPRELMFKMFTEPEHVARWWAPIPYTIPVCKIDLRPGGIWHYCMRSPEGDEQWVMMIYREIVEPERLVYNAKFADKDANPTDDIPEQLGTITFTEYEGKTKVTVNYQFATADDLKLTVNMGMIEGLTMTFGNLVNLLNEIQN